MTDRTGNRWGQCRINNSSKCSNCYQPRAFGGPAVLCLKFVLYCMQRRILEFRQTFGKANSESILHMLCSSGSQTVVREGLQRGTRDPSVLVHKKKTFCFSLSRFVNKFLHFCVLPLIVSKNGHYNFSQPFCSCRMCVKSGLPNFWSNDIG